MRSDLITYLPTVYTGNGPSYTAISIARAMVRQGHGVRLFCSGAVSPMPSEIDAVVPRLLGLPYPLVGRGPLKKAFVHLIERRVLNEIARRGPGVHLHLWGGASPTFVKRAKAAGAVIFRELINTHQGTAKRILDAEAKRLAVAPQHTITDEAIALQQAELSQCDYLCSPSAAVDASLAEWGHPEQKLIRTTFGWDPLRFATAGKDAPARSSPEGEVTALFVGEISVRKGVHLALEAWKASGAKGKFVLVGRVHPGMRTMLEENIGLQGIEHHRFTPDIAAFYRTADFLLFPTLEEGAPLICYEATGCGLPVVTTAMGSARLIEHEVNGLIVDAHDQDALVKAIRRMGDRAFRDRLSAAATVRAADHTWDEAAADRACAFARVGSAFGVN